MKLVVGLGNPGPRYARTRHNVGFRVARHFAARHAIPLEREDFRGIYGSGWLQQTERHDAGSVPLEVGVLLPQTYMNLSGAAVAEALAELPVEDPVRDLLVVVDDVDLAFGRLRVRARGGAGGQRGLGHVIECLGHKDFARLRFGIGRPAGSMETADHVLEGFSTDEEAALPAHLERAAEAVETAVREGAAAAMNHFNRDPQPPSDASESPECA